jgi:hypothetical protein
MDYLSNNYIYQSQPEYIGNFEYITNDKKENNFLTDKQIEILLEPYQNNNANNNANNKIIIFLFIFFIFLTFSFFNF